MGYSLTVNIVPSNSAFFVTVPGHAGLPGWVAPDLSMGSSLPLSLSRQAEDRIRHGATEPSTRIKQQAESSAV